jgi:hypothetical protein
MSKEIAHNRSRRAFLTGAGSLAAALVTAPHADGAQAPARSTSQSRDLGLWVTWYDLPDAARNDHLAWAHGTYIPALLKRPGYLWAANYASIADATASRVSHTDDPAVPTGKAYILAVGAEDTNVFGKLAPEELHAALSQEDRKMLAMRIGERVNIFAEASRVTGPGAKEYEGGMTLAPCIQLGSYNIDYRKEVEILAWYAQLQMPNMTVAPGCVRTRKLASVSGWAKMAILYEFGSVDLRLKTFGGGRGGTPHKWSRTSGELIHAPGSPNVARRIWPPTER